jgi:hypothetical protein
VCFLCFVRLIVLCTTNISLCGMLSGQLYMLNEPGPSNTGAQLALHSFATLVYNCILVQMHFGKVWYVLRALFDCRSACLSTLWQPATPESCTQLDGWHSV